MSTTKLFAGDALLSFSFSLAGIGTLWADEKCTRRKTLTLDSQPVIVAYMPKEQIFRLTVESKAVDMVVHAHTLPSMVALTVNELWRCKSRPGVISIIEIESKTPMQVRVADFEQKFPSAKYK